MTLRRLILIISGTVLSLIPCSAASFETTNFTVNAPTSELARRFGEMAEVYRREKALEWLGYEMPPWQRKCPIRVIVTLNGAGGATTFTFGSRNGQPAVMAQEMEIRGEVKQLLNSVLPHEVTHTVFAHHFGRAVPRWADEGGSVLSENDDERYTHDVRCRELLNAGRAIRLRVLFRLGDYPRDMIVLYAQGYSVAAWLVERAGGGQAGRQALLRFLELGMQGGEPRPGIPYHGSIESWNQAARQVYGIDGVDSLEQLWLDSLKTTAPNRIAARGSSGLRNGGDLLTSHVRSEIRSSASPMPLLEPPVTARGATPESDRYPSSSFVKDPFQTSPFKSLSSFPNTDATPASRPLPPDKPRLLLLPPEIPYR